MIAVSPEHALLRGEVAQLVEHTTENRSVDSSILSLATIPTFSHTISYNERPRENSIPENALGSHWGHSTTQFKPDYRRVIADPPLIRHQQVRGQSPRAGSTIPR
jgi:hypothetical protein